MKKLSPVRAISLLGTTLILLASNPLRGQNSYSDPQGRFTLAVPAGWAPSVSNGVLTLSRGDAYSILIPFSGGGAEEILSSAVKQIASQTQNVRQVSTQQETVGGNPASFEALVGTNPKGVQAFVGVYGVVANGQGYAIIQSGPMSEFSNLAGDMDAIVRSIRFGGSGGRGFANPGFGNPQGGSGSGNSGYPDSSNGSYPNSAQRYPQGGYPGTDSYSAPSGGGSMFESQDHSVAFPTPAGWTVRTADGNGASYYVLDRNGGQERILVANGPATAGSIQELAQQGVQFVTQQMPALQPDSTPRFSQVHGAPLATISYIGNAQGMQVHALHLITLQNGQYLGVLGFGDSNNSRMIQDACQTIVSGARLMRARESEGPGNAAALVGNWEWYKSTVVSGATTRCSTEKHLGIYANGRYEYMASTYCPNMPTDIDPTTRISGTYSVSGSTIIGHTDDGRTATYTFRLLQGGQILEIGGDQYLRK